MTEVTSAVALLFDDVELGNQLRAALQERGARIVHEGDIASLSRQRLDEVAADVVVVSLDDAATDALDQLYGLIDGDSPRVVFNDAQASRGLAGWDRDRWARHLAVKVLQTGDIDPPRPADADMADAPADPGHTPATVTPMDAAEVADAPMIPVQPPEALPDPEITHATPEDVQRRNSESESLSAELEALLASAELSGAADESPLQALQDVPEPVDELEALLASAQPPAAFDPDSMDESASLAPGDTLAPVDTESSASAGAFTFTDPPETRSAVEPHDFLLDLPAGLTLSAPEVDDTPSAEPHEAAAVDVPADWALVDADAPVADLPPNPGDAQAFGIDKVSAADFLAPDEEEVAGDYEPVMSLELVSMEEAIAPQAMHVPTEMHLDDLHMALSRLVLTGAAADGAMAAAEFFAALPAASRLTFVHVQHLHGQSADALVAQLAAVCPLTVRLATAGSFTQPGEVLVAPPGQLIRVHRDGRVELRPDANEAQEPSIDDSFRAGAEAFGRDALAIVFSGQGADAVAGAQAVRDHGGSVWVESTATGYADMVSDITAEGPVDFSGTPLELAARLIKVFP